MPSQDWRVGDGAGFCIAGIQSIGDTDTRKRLVSPDLELSINRQLAVLGISKGTYYYQPKGESDENLDIMKKIDQHMTEHPTSGVIGMRDNLATQGFRIGVNRVRRLMRKMGLMAIFPLKSLSKLGMAKYRKPYLLRNLTIAHANQVWSVDISYIPMAHGFMYLTAIIDVYSRAIMAWGLHNSLDAENSIEVLQLAIASHGKPEIINSDQGSQYTCPAWEEACDGIRMSMDGRRRCLDNVWIERFWRTIKREYVYINPTDSVKELRDGIKNYIEYYNYKRPHQGIGHQIPMRKYDPNAA